MVSGQLIWHSGEPQAWFRSRQEKTWYWKTAPFSSTHSTCTTSELFTSESFYLMFPDLAWPEKTQVLESETQHSRETIVHYKKSRWGGEGWVRFSHKTHVQVVILSMGKVSLYMKARCWESLGLQEFSSTLYTFHKEVSIWCMWYAYILCGQSHRKK